MMEQAFIRILNMSLGAGFVILVVLLLRLALKGAPKVCAYALWVVVFFRLLCPLPLESGWSLVPVQQDAIRPEIVYEAAPQVHTGMGFLDRLINPLLPPATPDKSANPLQLQLYLGQLVWGSGMALLVLYSLAGLIRLRLRLIGAVKLEGNIYLADRIASPFVLGLFRPRIYLPSRLSERERALSLLHEKAHIRRLDHVAKLLAYLALVLHWFNPLVWLAFCLMTRDMEHACDEAVMKAAEQDIRAEYAATLLDLATGRRILGGAPLAFGEGGAQKRIKHVMGYRKPKPWVLAAALVLVLASVSLLAASRPAREGASGSSSFSVVQAAEHVSNL